MRSYGFIESGKSPDDIILTESTDTKEYKRKPVTVVQDQGSEGSCVSQSLWELYNFRSKFNPRTDQFTSDPAWVFHQRKDKSLNGMTPREALEIMKNNGMISSYARITNILALKKAILANGGALVAMIAKSDNNDFWNGSSILGGHAVAAIGYDNDNIYFKNSWGTEYGDNGEYYLPIDQFNAVTEAWTIMG